MAKNQVLLPKYERYASDAVIYKNPFQAIIMRGDHDLRIPLTRPSKNNCSDFDDDLLLQEEKNKQQMIEKAQQMKQMRKEQKKLSDTLGGQNYAASVRHRMVVSAQKQKQEAELQASSLQKKRAEQPVAALYSQAYFARSLSVCRHSSSDMHQLRNANKFETRQHLARSRELEDALETNGETQEALLCAENQPYITFGMFDRQRAKSAGKTQSTTDQLARAEQILKRTMQHVQLVSSSSYVQRCASSRKKAQQVQASNNLTVSALK